MRINLPVPGLLIHYHGQITPVKNQIEFSDIGKGGPIMLFDGVCNLCRAGVRFFFNHDPRGRIRYCAMQSETGQKLLAELGLPLTDFNTIAVLDGTDIRFRSDAFFHLVRQLPLRWRFLEAGRIVPRFIRDWVYDRIAGTRYRVFGRQKICMTPTDGEKARFI